MLLLPLSKRGRYIDFLSSLYSIFEFYPPGPGLDECEVKILKQEPSAYGGSADCWVGEFLGQHQVAMKTLRAHIPNDVLAKVALTHSCLTTHSNSSQPPLCDSDLNER